MKTDLKVAIRSIAAEPGFALVVVLTLALAIGVNSAIFSVLHGVLLRPLPYVEPDRLVMLWESNRQLDQLQANVSGATYLDWRARSRTFSSIGAFRHRGFTLDQGRRCRAARERRSDAGAVPCARRPGAAGSHLHG